MIDEKMEFCSSCSEWVETNARDDGYNTDRGFCTVFVSICCTCGEVTSTDGPVCIKCDQRVNPDEGEIIDGEMICDECLAIEEAEL